MRRNLPTRPRLAAFLAVPLLVIALLAGTSLVANLDAGARAVQVRGLASFEGTLTALVHELQRERWLSERGTAPEARKLRAARQAVDRAAVAYRYAAVRLDVSDRDRRLHHRLDDGLAALAALERRRAAVDRGPQRSGAAPGYTETIGDLLTVNSEIGLREAGDDAGLLRAVAASAAFSRAMELADRERLVAAQAVSLGRLDDRARMRLASMSGRQDALLDQFHGLAGSGQRALSARLLPGAETLRLDRLRRAALDGRARGARGLAAWSAAASARVEGMRAVEVGLVGEVRRLAGQAESAADRRAALYSAALLLALLLGPVLWLLAGSGTPARGTTASRLDSPGPARPRAAERGVVAPAAEPAHSAGLELREPEPQLREPSGSELSRRPERGVQEPRPLPALLDLARRNQALVDEQRALLLEATRNRTDPRLPGKLLQLDRLVGHARRNAYNLIVLAGGEPSRRWERPTPLTEMARAAVRDNRDAARVDVQLTDDRLLVGAAADDLAGLLAELVDNATSFSEPETRVRVSGQATGSGYVLEVEDRGLGMTDEELQEVNGRLAGRQVADEDLRQRFGTWVIGRLADRHDLKVRLRRSARGGVTALVFVPERLLVGPGAARGQAAAARDAAVPEQAGAETDQTAMTRLPARRYLTHLPEATAPDPAVQSLPKRAPSTSLAPDLAAAQAQRQLIGRSEERQGARSPDEVRNMLTRYRSGVERGRADARDLPDPGDEPRP
jgi:nitrate/nitrite sensing protein/histidine kinase/DNA gyrase B/HSP90-like ATPase